MIDEILVIMNIRKVYLKLSIILWCLDSNRLLFLQTFSMQGNQLITKTFLYIAFTIEIVAWQLSVALVIVLGALGYLGFDGGKPISTTCTRVYFTTKYGVFTNILQITFIGSIIATILLTLTFVVLLVWVIRVCKSENASTSVSRKTTVILYLAANVCVLSIIPIFGHYLSQIVQLWNCKVTCNPGQLIAILVLAALLFAFTLVHLILMLIILCKKNQTDSQAYRDVQSHPTEPYEQNKNSYKNQPYNRRNSPPQRNQTRNVPNAQHTRQNLFEQQENNSKKVYTYKEKDQPKQNFYHTNKKYAQQSDINSKYIPPESSHTISPKKRINNADNIMLNRRINEDNQQFKVERSRYVNKFQQGSILPSKGLQEKSPYERKGPSNSNTYERQRRNEQSPRRHLDNEAVLISHIRGKYA